MKKNNRIVDFFAVRLQRKILLLILLLVIPVMSGMSAYWVTTQRRTASETLAARAERMAGLLSQTLAAPLWNLDIRVLQAQLDAVIVDPDLFSIGVYEQERAVPVVGDQREGEPVDAITREMPIIYVRDQEQITLGTVRLVYTHEFVHQDIARTQYAITAFILALGVLLALGIYVMLRQMVENPIQQMSAAMGRVAAGDFSARVALRSRDEVGQLAQSLNWMVAELQNSYADMQTLNRELEARVKARTQRLETIATLSEDLNVILDMEELLPNVVDVICERFDLYYAGVFLIDATGQWAVLRAGSGSAGQAMLAANHRLQIGGQSMIGAAISEQQARIALDVGEEAVRFDNPHLPDTHSEMALPLISRGGVIGALTIQSVQSNAFSEDDITELQTVANQIAVAIENARLFAESQAALEEIEAVQRRYIGQAWGEFLHGTSLRGYRQTGVGTEPLGDLLPEVTRVLEGGGQPFVAAEAEDATRLVVPIKFRDRAIGAVGIKEDMARAWTQEDIALAEAIAEQLALAAENLRLLDETQRRAARERLTREITDNIRAAVSVEDAMRRALEQMGQLFNVSEMVARIGTADALRGAAGPDGGDEHE